LDGTVDRTTNMHRAIGQGSVSGHFGEIIQGSFRDPDGAIVRALVTLRCPLFQAWALFELTSDTEVTIEPSYCVKAKRAAENTLAYVGLLGQGGRLHIKSNAPIGIGAGSSTGDVVAAIRAVNEACRAGLTPMEVARLAVDTETAIDPIMLRASPEVLFTYRNGTVLERFSRCLPSVRVLGFTDGQPVDTVNHPPARYDRVQIAEFEELRNRLRRAIDRADTADIGRIATRSAEINQAYLPKPSWLLLRDIVRDAGAIGLAVSHSGSAVALLFDPRPDRSDVGMARARHRLDEAGICRRWHFLAGGSS
jgi:uncharacterized protein involved in propanediol utilization